MPKFLDDSLTAAGLFGQFVRLRPLVVADAAITFRWRQSARAAGMNRGATTIKKQARWIECRPDDEFNFIIELLNSGTPVGMISLINWDQVHSRAEVGRLLIGEPAAVRGLPVAIEALAIIYELAFERLELNRIYGIVVAGHKRMIAFHLFFGMKEEGRLRSHFLVDDTFQDAICLGLLSDEYRTIALPKMRAWIKGDSTDATVPVD